MSTIYVFVGLAVFAFSSNANAQIFGGKSNSSSNRTDVSTYRDSTRTNSTSNNTSNTSNTSNSTDEHHDMHQDEYYDGPTPFQVMDADGDGMIQKNEARQFFMAMKYFEEEMGAGLHEEDFIEGFDEMDTDGDDLVDEEEFLNP